MSNADCPSVTTVANEYDQESSSLTEGGSYSNGSYSFGSVAISSAESGTSDSASTSVESGGIGVSSYFVKERRRGGVYSRPNQTLVRFVASMRD